MDIQAWQLLGIYAVPIIMFILSWKTGAFKKAEDIIILKGKVQGFEKEIEKKVDRELITYQLDTINNKIDGILAVENKNGANINAAHERIDELYKELN